MNLHRYLSQALLALLALYTKNVYSEKPYCSLNKSAEGQWVNETYPFARSFARSANLDVWNRERFPWQQKYYSCYFTDGNQVHGRGFDTENRRFVPSTCSYRQFSPSKFLELMRGRTLLICCDSLSYQMAVNLAGSLHSATTVDYDKKEHFIYYPEYNFTLVNAYTNKYPINNKPHTRNTLAEYQDFGNLRPNYDVMVINFGLHFNIGGMHKLAPLLRAIAEEYIRDKDKLPFVLWKETTPQHYDNQDNHPAGYYSKEQDPMKECKPYANLNAARAADVRVTLPIEILLPAGIPIMYVYNATRTEWWAHVGKSKAWTDCIHFCDVAGVHMFMREILYNHLVETLSSLRVARLALLLYLGIQR